MSSGRMGRGTAPEVSREETLPDDRSGLSEGTAKEKRSQGQLQAGSNVSGAQLRFAKQSNNKYGQRPKRAPLPSPIQPSEVTRPAEISAYPSQSPRNWRSQYPGSRDGGTVADWIPDIR